MEQIKSNEISAKRFTLLMKNVPRFAEFNFLQKLDTTLSNAFYLIWHCSELFWHNNDFEFSRREKSNPMSTAARLSA